MPSSIKSKQKKNTGTLEDLPVAALVHDLSSIVEANTLAKKILKLTKISDSELKKINLLDLIDPSHKTKFEKHIKGVLNKGQSEKLITELALKGEHNKQVELISNCLIKTKKKVIQSLIIERESNTTSLNGPTDYSDIFRDITDNSPDVIFKMEFFPQTRITYISASCEKVLGFTQEEILKDPKVIEPYLLGEDKKFAISSKEEFENLIRAIGDNKSQARIMNKKGEIKFLEVTANPVSKNKNEITGFVGVIRDVSDRMLAEELLLDTKSKFDLITNYGNDIITFYTYLPQERYIYVSPNIERILGYKPNQLLKDSDFFMRRLLSDKKAFEEGELEMRLFQKEGVIKDYRHVYRTKNAKGKEVWLENISTPIMNTKGKIGFYLNILKDITDEKIKEIEIEKQYINYRELLDNSPAAYIIHDQGKAVYSNLQLQSLLKYSQKEILGKSVTDFFTEESRSRVVQRIKEIYKKSNLNQFYNYTLVDKEGKAIEVEVKSVFVKFDNKDCVLSLVNNLSRKKVLAIEKEKMKATAVQNLQLEKEIKERQLAEKSLLDKTAHLTSILESSTHLIWTVDRNNRLTSFNENFAKVVKQQHGIDVKVGSKIDEQLKNQRQDYIDYWYPIYAESFKGKKLEFEKKDFIQGKGEVHRRVFINPIFDEHNNIQEISCIANDITDSKLYEKKLMNQTAKLTAIFDSSHHYIWTIDRQERLTSFNKNYFDIISSLYNTKPYLGLVLNRGILSNNLEYNMLLKSNYKTAFEGRATSFEIEILDRNNKKIHLEVFLNPIFEKEKVIEVSGIAHNITEKKQAQQKIEVSLKEKEILLKEVHHRVKNNMQVVSSILNLQSSYVSDEYALALLKESQNRIKTMAYIHESLYQNKSFSSVNFSEYTKTLVSNIIHSYSSSKDKIKLELNIESVILPLDNSIPAGLIINELVTNAIKHAFPGMRQGTIWLDLKYEKEFVLLSLRDNGVGFSEHVSFQNSNSLGLQLVNTLIEQIDGTYKFNSEKDIGTEIQIKFKM